MSARPDIRRPPRGARATRMQSESKLWMDVFLIKKAPIPLMPFDLILIQMISHRLNDVIVINDRTIYIGAIYYKQLKNFTM